MSLHPARRSFVPIFKSPFETQPEHARTQFAVLYQTPNGQDVAHFPTRRAANNAITYINGRRKIGKTQHKPVALLRIHV